MKIMRWIIVFLPVATAFVITVAVREHAAHAAPPQAAVAPAAPSLLSAAVPTDSDALSIPDTTLAINSAAPMSQRVVHYTIDAHYNATTHTVDANEVLTYHNLTGQSLDHFPFHLYQSSRVS